MSRPVYSRVTITLATSLTIVAAAGTAAAVQRHDIGTAAAASPQTTGPLLTVDVAARATHVVRARPRPAKPRTTRQTSARRVVVAHAPAVRVTRRHRAVHHRARHAVTGPTGWAALDNAIARIPSYRPAGAIWRVSRKYGSWGTADWYHDTIYISPSVPADRLYDVVTHEWSHELSVLDYAADVDSAVAAMNTTFGGSGLTGAERAADCMAILQGATWTHYTSCHDSGWRHAAATLLAGRRL